MNPWFGSVWSNVAVPPADEMTGAGEVTMSQWAVGLQLNAVGATPSHCSTNTFALGVKPATLMSNACGLPATSCGTTNGLPVGAVMLVAALAGPAIAITPARRC